ncbi:hypothetical protein HK098_001412 [Nowakowskiella sp. JEL0407]|nr:hypothetical protein HK098_001412 [Nowakowskiella sp. JEL0407]
MLFSPFKQILSRNEVCNFASKTNQPSPIPLITWYYSVEYNYTEALKSFASSLETLKTNYYLSAKSADIGNNFRGSNPPFLFTAMMAYMLMRAYTFQNAELIWFYLTSAVTVVFRKLVKRFYDTRDFRFCHFSLFIYATKFSKDLLFIQQLLAKFPTALNLMERNLSPLHIAAFCGNVKLVKLLLSFKEVDPNAVTEKGITPLHVACIEDHDEVALVLLKRTKNPHVLDTQYRTPLVYCAVFDSIKCAKVLMTNIPRANPNSPDTRGRMPLHYCSVKSPSKVLKYLLEWGVNVKAKDDLGKIPLHDAVQSTDPQNCKQLVGFDPLTLDIQTGKNLTPLTLAIMSGRCKTVEYLLSIGSNIKTEFNLELFYKSLKQVDAIYPRNLVDESLASIYLSLLTYGFDPKTTIATHKNETLLHHACQRGKINTVLVLLAYGANPGQKNSDGKTPFSFACEYKHLDIVKLIFKGVHQTIVAKLTDRSMGKFKDSHVKPQLQGMNSSTVQYQISEFINKQDEMGNTALMDVVGDDEKIEIVECLITARTKVNVKNKVGDTALHIAIRSGAYSNAMCILRYASPNPYIKNNEGKAPRDLVVLGHYHPIAKALRGEEVDWESLVKNGAYFKPGF